MARRHQRIPAGVPECARIMKQAACHCYNRISPLNKGCDMLRWRPVADTQGHMLPQLAQSLSGLLFNCCIR
ncbi:hypothetical protein GCM10010981_35810 [Dyella nitratireducens]|uniref:Uncharacterized protein n=1 Tax=Dyella nitratireducens TaxID=1849580 RepID=A0ABQ1GGR6_9GAMM|nr:hypothetical protein GCM10010981_35810 [Dyella nitratireducens]GLQ41863.1 hypothetical protein GCM10007902_17130 [Dyella nitratireducens]